LVVAMTTAALHHLKALEHAQSRWRAGSVLASYLYAATMTQHNSNWSFTIHFKGSIWFLM